MSAVAFYECTRCQVRHYERFDWLYVLHLRHQSKHGIQTATEAEATVETLRQREERQRGGNG